MLLRKRKTVVDRYNTCIVVVTYNPGTNFSNILKRYVQISDKIVIVDNHSSVDVLKYVPENVIEHFQLIRASSNRGIAWGLNQGVLYAKSCNYQYVLTFDQDTFPVSNILECYSTILTKVSNVGLIGTSYSDTITTISSTMVTYKNKNTLITSGTLHPIWIFDQVGLYDEDLFIDSVDFDFALRVKIKFEVLRVNEPLICHELGSPVIRYGLVSSNHLALRRYYMARNHVLICKKYLFLFPWWIMKKNLFFFMSLLKMIIVETNRKEKCKKTWSGFIDGIKK